MPTGSPRPGAAGVSHCVSWALSHKSAHKKLFVSGNINNSNRFDEKSSVEFQEMGAIIH